MRIAILGAGIGGLTLANLLEGNGHSVIVFERDTSIDARAQGYSIGLRGSDGLDVAKKISTTFYERLVGSGEWTSGFKMCTTTGWVLMNLKGGKPGSQWSHLQLSRSALRRFLFDNLKAEQQAKVMFGYQCTGYTKNQPQTGEDDKHPPILLQFADGKQCPEPFDLVVACDGVRSKIRKQLIGDELKPLLINLGGRVKGLEEARTHSLLTGGSIFTFGDGLCAFVAQQVDKQTAETQWSVSVTATKEELEEANNNKRWRGHLTQTEDLKAEILKFIAEKRLHSPIPLIIEKTPLQNMNIRVLLERDTVDSWQDERVVLLGDAAHPMTPFRGQGANGAMKDAEELANRINSVSEASFNNVCEALQEYNTNRRKPMHQAVKDSHDAAIEAVAGGYKRDMKYLAIGTMISVFSNPKTTLAVLVAGGACLVATWWT